MGKSDDSINRRKNKRSRRKAEEKKDASSKVSSRVAAIIAAKKRRLTGKRRMCQGMCFTLPTPEDPFNEMQGKVEPMKKRKKNSKENKKAMDKKSPRLKTGSLENDDAGEHLHEENDSLEELGLGKNVEGPSKFLVMCLNSIQKDVAIISEGDKPLFANAWGLKFFNCYSTGKDVLETNGADSKLEQIAWIASTAADAVSMKEKEGISYTGPVLLYLVPSQDKASMVRGVCKPLKALGIHTVSLHSGASIDHQINGLKSCEPQFLVSTPERLLELLSLKAVDISGVSLLIIDGLEAPFRGTYVNAVKSIRKFITGNLRSVVFSDCTNSSSLSIVQKLLRGSDCK